MDKFLNSVWAKVLRIVLPAVAILLGFIPGSYLESVPVTDENGYAVSVNTVATNYFDFAGRGLSDWAPLICMLLCVAAVVCAVICMYKETENTLTVLANMLCMGLVADFLIMIFLNPTIIGWCIAGLLAVGLVITAAQEMKMEDAKK